MQKIAALAALLGLATCISCSSKSETPHPSATYQVTRPLQQDTLIYQEYVCQIHSIQHIELRALERGYLQKIYVDEGQFVKKGQLMFQIMPLLYQAERQKAQAEVDFARIEYQNTKSLADSNIVSPNELALAKARLDKAKAELSMADVHLGFTEIRAPFDGIMDRLSVRQGSLVEEGELLTRLSDNSQMWVYFNVPEAEYLDYMAKVNAKHQPTLVKLQMANHKEFPHLGEVKTIEAEFNNETGNIAFRATFPNPQGILRHGETGNVLMPVPLRNALLIPQEATFEILDKKFVYVVDQSGKVESRHIEVGTEMPHLFAVVDGIEPTEMVLVEGLRKVKNGEVIHFKLSDQKEILKDLNTLHAE